MTATVSRLGQVNAAGDVNAMFLKLFGGEVFTAFEVNTVFRDKHYSRQISNGRSAAFPSVGTVAVQNHTPGARIAESVVPLAEKVITVEGKIIASASIADIDEALNHYDVREPISTEIGRQLAYHYDRNVARSMILAARSSNPLTGRPGGARITNTNIGTDAALLDAGLFTAAQTLDEKDIPADGRYFFLRPAQFYLLAQRDRLLNKDIGGSGAIKDGTLETVAGITLVKTNNLPTADDTSNALVPTAIRANYTANRGVVAHKMAAGSVQLMTLAMEMEREIRNQSFFMVGSYAVGHDWLRPECAVEFATA